MGLPTDRQPATVLHHVDVFFLHRNIIRSNSHTQEVLNYEDITLMNNSDLVPSRKFQCRPMKAQMSSFHLK